MNERATGEPASLLEPGENHYQIDSNEQSLDQDGVRVVNSILGVEDPGVVSVDELPYRIDVKKIITHTEPYFNEYLGILAQKEIGLGLDVVDNRIQLTNLEMGVNADEIVQEFFGIPAPKKIYAGQVYLPDHLVNAHTHPSRSGQYMRPKKEKPPLFVTPKISYEDILPSFHPAVYLQLIFNAAYLLSGYVPTVALIKTKESIETDYQFLIDWHNDRWGQTILYPAIEQLLGEPVRAKRNGPDDRSITENLGIGIYRGIIALNASFSRLTRSR